MRIIKVNNPYFPEKDTYKCTIGNETYHGSYSNVIAWRDHMLANSDYYNELKELNIKACKEFYN